MRPGWSSQGTSTTARGARGDADQSSRGPAGEAAQPEPPVDERWRAHFAALERAAARVQQEWAQTAAPSAPRDVGPHLATIADAIRRAALGAGESLPRGLPALLPVGRLVDMLRRRLLDEIGALDDAGGPAQSIGLLQAVERVAAALEADVARRFADRLAGPDGFNLIVEVAHDLRSPLTSILFLAEVLRNGQSGPLNAVQERQLGLIYSAAFGLSTVAADLIELARGADRLVEMHPMTFSVADCMMSMRDIVVPMAEEKGLEIRLQMPDADFRVGHPAALSRALLNLTTNAIKFTSAGYVEVVGKPIGRGKVEFSVRDTGRGIPADVMSTLYEPFARRYHKSSEFAFSSTGLGLSICRKLVSAMGGQLQVETSPDAGTRFFFVIDLPLASKL